MRRPRARLLMRAITLSIRLLFTGRPIPSRTTRPPSTRGIATLSIGREIRPPTRRSSLFLFSLFLSITVHCYRTRIFSSSRASSFFTVRRSFSLPFPDRFPFKIILESPIYDFLFDRLCGRTSEIFINGPIANTSVYKKKRTFADLLTNRRDGRDTFVRYNADILISSLLVRGLNMYYNESPQINHS